MVCSIEITQSELARHGFKLKSGLQKPSLHHQVKQDEGRFKAKPHNTPTPRALVSPLFLNNIVVTAESTLLSGFFVVAVLFCFAFLSLILYHNACTRVRTPSS